MQKHGSMARSIACKTFMNSLILAQEGKVTLIQDNLEKHAPEFSALIVATIN
jgi:hypothetical protein